jgi:hypothetical protein
MHRRVELFAVFSLKLIAAAHRADIGRQHGAAGVFKTLLGFKQRLFAHHALPAHFLHLIIAVGNHPVAAQQFGGLRADIVDGDGVGEHVTIGCLIGLVGEIVDFGLHHDFMRVGIFHARHLNRFRHISQGLRRTFVGAWMRLNEAGGRAYRLAKSWA